MSERTTYRVAPYSQVQHQGVDWSAVMSRQHTIHGLLEFDVTETRRAIHRHRQATGEPLSFTALLVATFAHEIARDTAVQAYRKGKGRVVLFDEVDVAVLVEHVVDGQHVPIPHIVRGADRKTPAQVDAEIRAARTGPDPYAGARRYAAPWLLLPAPLRRFAIGWLLSSPARRKRYTGTAAVTAVGMFGSGTGWGVPIISHSLCMTVGGIGRRPGIAPGGAIEARDVVCLTLSLDHDVVDGAPAARFISRLRKAVETATLLDSAAVRPAVTR